MDTETLDLCSISMLYREALDRLTEIASQSRGGILELGSYVGGSTIALAKGNRGKHPHAVIECGGSHAHPTHGSSDIIADWRANMIRFGFEGAARLCRGWGYDPAVQAEAIAHANPIGLFFMDADGYVAAPLRIFARHMQPDCLLALDDYWAPGAEEKASIVKPFVDAHVAAGRLIQHGLEGGTWFGRIAGQQALDHFASMAPIRRDRGHCFLTPVVNAHLCDTPEHEGQSPLRLFEDGRELGPAHTWHDGIRELGGGRFSHWDAGYFRWLFWSTSDNTDPTLNGRTYEADWGHGRVPLADV